MKIRFFYLVLLIFLSSTAYSQDYKTKIEDSRKEKHRSFKEDNDSPIKDKSSFKGLNYFPVDESFKTTGKLVRLPGMKLKTFETSSGIQKTYKLYGNLIFDLNGREFSLPVYQSMVPIKGYEDHLFVPFLDQTSGNETYGAGRYQDFYIPENFNEVIVDFNTAYNPYCAYSDGYACPIPTQESFLDIEIIAGEKNYK